MRPVGRADCRRHLATGAPPCAGPWELPPRDDVVDLDDLHRPFSSTRAMNLEGAIPRARQSRKRTSTVGDFLSLSSMLTYVRCRPAALANCSWVKPVVWRAFRSSAPIT